MAKANRMDVIVCIGAQVTMVQRPNHCRLRDVAPDSRLRSVTDRIITAKELTQPNSGYS